MTDVLFVTPDATRCQCRAGCQVKPQESAPSVVTHCRVPAASSRWLQASGRLFAASGTPVRRALSAPPPPPAATGQTDRPAGITAAAEQFPFTDTCREAAASSEVREQQALGGAC